MIFSTNCAGSSTSLGGHHPFIARGPNIQCLLCFPLFGTHLSSSGWWMGVKGTMPPLPSVEIRPKKMAANCGHIDFMFLNPLLPSLWNRYCYLLLSEKLVLVKLSLPFLPCKYLSKVRCGFSIKVKWIYPTHPVCPFY